MRTTPAQPGAAEARPATRFPARIFQQLIYSPLWVAVAIFALALLVYTPALNGDFLWDDFYLVGANPFFKSPIFVFEVFRRYLFLDSFSLYYRPVQNLTYMVDYWLWNRNPFGYHFSNVCFHAASGFLLFILLGKLLPRLLPAVAWSSARQLPVGTHRTIAFCVSLLWVVHPIHSAAVAYVSGRADSLVCLFALGSWLIQLRADSSGQQRWKQFLLNSLAMALLLLALCSKEIAFIWIVLYLFHLLGFERERAWSSKLRVIGGILLVFLAYWALRHLPDARPAQQSGDPMPLAARFILMLGALGDYISLVFAPLNLHMERTILNTSRASSAAAWQQNIRFEYLVILAVLTIISSAWVCWKKWLGQQLRVFGAAWFVIGFLPISNLFPLNAQAAEHWIYMPSIGLLILAAGCAVALPRRSFTFLGALTCVALTLFSIRTAVRSADWVNCETFYTRTIQAGGGTPRVHLNLASVYTERKDFVTAEKILRDTYQRFPDYTTVRITLGMTLLRAGKTEEAEKYLSFNKNESDQMARQFTNTWSAALSLAHVRNDAKKTNEAITILDDAITRYGNVWDLIRFKAQLTQQQAGPSSAAKVIQSYTDEHWWNYDAFMVLGRMEAAAGENEGALAAFRRASRLDIHSVEPFSNIARIELALNRPAVAYQSQQQAVRRGSNQPSQYLLLAAILDQMNRKSEAAEAVHQAEILRAAANQNRSEKL